MNKDTRTEELKIALEKVNRLLGLALIRSGPQRALHIHEARSICQEALK